MATAISMGFLVHAQAADFLEIMRDAKANDSAFASARSALEAGREKLPQGRSLVLPTLSASANAGNTYNNVSSLASAGTTKVERDPRNLGWTVALSQPLYRPQNWIQYDQAEYQVAQSEAQFGLATQDLIVRTAQAYFDVLTSQDNLAFIQAQKTAISEQLAQARRNFEVGTATITDTNEAQARFDLAISQEIAAQNDIEFKKRALQLIIGKFPEHLTPLGAKFTLSPPQPNRMDDWVESAQKASYAVRIQEASSVIAEREIQRNRAGHLPTLDVVGSVGRALASNNVNTGIGTDIFTTSIGLQLAVPIYQGGVVNSRIREAIANRDRSNSDLENARRQAALTARQSFLGVTNGMAQVRALEQAVISSESSLASNRLGYDVGVRINIDVLNAQQQLFSTKRDLAKARYDTIMNGLRLKAAAGSLAETDLEDVNRLLGSN